MASLSVWSPFNHRAVPELQRSRSAGRTFQGVLFEGSLQVVDAEAFRKALAHGIGPGKAFGFGLLSVASE